MRVMNCHMLASKSPHLTQTNMVSTLRPVPSLICWQIRCLVVIPAGEGLHEGAIAIRVEHRGDFMPSCGTPCGLPCPPRGDRPSREGIYPDPGECRGRPQLHSRTTSSFNRIMCIFGTFFVFFFPKFSYFTIFDYFWRLGNICVFALYHLAGSNMP